jgi:hypothetical protein
MAAHFGGGDEFNGGSFLTEEEYRPMILHLIPARSPVKAFRFDFKNPRIESSPTLLLTERCAAN